MKAMMSSHVNGMRINNLDAIGPRNGRRFLVCDITHGEWTAVRWEENKPKECGDYEHVLYFSKRHN